jgi:xanthine dehydrogenase YagT iron-sulfur-binding subunit
MSRPPDSRKPVRGGVSRRGFIGSLGAGAAAAATIGTARGESDAAVAAAGELAPVTLTVDGRAHRLRVEPRWTLAFVLREKLGLTATKVGCDRGECGACTVLIDGRPRYACLTLALEAEGREVTTLAGLMKGEELGEVQQAFAQEDAFQCGYCTPGQMMAAEGLLRANANPSVEEIRHGMSGNLCRCGAYPHIVKAVARAAEARRARGGAR